MLNFLGNCGKKISGGEEKLSSEKELELTLKRSHPQLPHEAIGIIIEILSQGEAFSNSQSLAALCLSAEIEPRVVARWVYALTDPHGKGLTNDIAEALEFSRENLPEILTRARKCHRSLLAKSSGRH